MTNDRRLEALLSMPVLSGPRVSPDGTWAAWSWSRLGPAADVFAAPTDGSMAPARLTETADDTRVVSWTPDGRALVVAQDNAGDERDRLFRVALDKPGVMEPLTEASPGYFVRGGQLHPNGRWLFYDANYDFGRDEEIEATWLYRHDLQTGERRVLARPRRANYYPPELDPTGERVLYSRSDEHPSGRRFWLVEADGSDDREILDFGPQAKVSASWFPDGRRVLFLVEDDLGRRLGVWEDGEIRWLLDGTARNVEYAFVPPNGETVVAVEVDEARVRAFLLDPGSGAETRLPDVPGNLIPLAPAAPTEDGAWTSFRYSAQSPPDLVRLDPESGEAASITGLWDLSPLGPEDLALAEDFRWRSADGMVMQGWLYRAPEGNAGTVVLIHGGPTSHAEDRFDAEVQYLVSRGFNVFCPNYRGSTGFGLGFREAIKEDGWGGREQEDIKTGIEALIRAGVAKPGRVGVTGTSYGGYSAWCQVTRHPPELVSAAAPICGMTDLVVDYNATRPDLRPYSEEMMGGSPEEVPERYRERSPVNFVENIRVPLLIAQGLRDPNVTADNVDAVVEELEKHRIPYDLLTFEDEGHGVYRPENLRTLYARLADFFEAAFGRP